MYQRFLFAVMIAVAFAGPVLAQPAMSRGEQLLSINYDECMRRAQAALSAEGYSGINPGGAFVYAKKGINGVYIMCNVAPESKTWVNIVVATVAEDSNIPGAERVKLQGRMEQGAGSPAVVQATWSTNATTYRGQNIRVTYNCPGGGTAATVWGTDYYTDDSSICTAAVHYGLISFANGGRVTIEMRQGAASYTGSTRNGVSSNNYGAWSGSYVFITN